MAGLNITNSSTIGFDLSDPAQNPVSIAAGVDISTPTGWAIGSAVPVYWTIVNSGSLRALGNGTFAYGIVLETGTASLTSPIANITNTQTGLIEGYYEAVAVVGAGTIVNLGTIIARADHGGTVRYDPDTSSYVAVTGGILLDSGGVSNASTGLIHGYYIGVAIDSGGSVINAGTIEGVSTVAGYGVVLGKGGSITNLLGGTISGSYDAIEVFANPASVFNQGLISASNRFAIVLDAGGTVTNAAGGTIAGGSSGIIFFRPGPSSVTNQAGGLITGGRYGVNVESTSPLTLDNAGILTGITSSGVFLHSGGSVINELSGTIHGGKYGLFSQDTTTVTNAGTVTGSDDVGVAILSAAWISNAASGQIISGRDGIYVGGGPNETIVNDGYILGGTGSGAILSATGAVTNDLTGTIAGGRYGVRFINSAGSVLNTGSIGAALAGKSAGILLDAGGYALNAAPGRITGQYFGVDVHGTTGTIINAGLIASQQTLYGAGVQLADGGSVTNEAGGSIRARWIGVQIGRSGTIAVGGTVDNQGTIIGTDGTNGAGIWISGPAIIENAATGTISGGAKGIIAYDQVTVINAGSIGGSLFGLDVRVAGFADRVVAEPGAVFSGIFSGGNTIGSSTYSTLELASGASAGTITNVGSFVDFGQIALDAGASWSLGGTILTGETILFGGSSASLTLLNPAAVHATLAGFTNTDTIVLAGIVNTTSVSFSGNTLVVRQSSGPDLNLLFAAPESLTYSVVDGATDITVACFARGTRIRTQLGEVAVETLRPGMRVCSAFGGEREVIWIGHRDIDCTRHNRPATVWPIQIDAGAFGAGLPASRLWVSPDHGIYVNEVLVPARFLVNGTTIRQVPVDDVSYYHVELPRHDVLFAEGLPAESYLDIGDRSNFSDSMPVGLFPDFSTPAPNLAAVWETQGCAPLVVHGPELDAIRAMVNAHAANAA